MCFSSLSRLHFLSFSSFPNGFVSWSYLPSPQLPLPSRCHSLSFLFLLQVALLHAAASDFKELLPLIAQKEASGSSLPAGDHPLEQAPPLKLVSVSTPQFYQNPRVLAGAVCSCVCTRVHVLECFRVRG